MDMTSHLSDAYDAFSSSCFSFFALGSNDDVSNESDDEVSGSGFTSGSYSFPFISKNSVGCVSSSKYVTRVSSSKSVARSS